MIYISALYFGPDDGLQHRVERAVGRTSDDASFVLNGWALLWQRQTKKAADRIFKILNRFQRLTVTMENEDD